MISNSWRQQLAGPLSGSGPHASDHMPAALRITHTQCNCTICMPAGYACSRAESSGSGVSSLICSSSTVIVGQPPLRPVSTLNMEEAAPTCNSLDNDSGLSSGGDEQPLELKWHSAATTPARKLSPAPTCDTHNHTRPHSKFLTPKSHAAKRQQGDEGSSR
jgi:hypothetical protein